MKRNLLIALMALTIVYLGWECLERDQDITWYAQELNDFEARVDSLKLALALSGKPSYTVVTP
jgi:hypothetical protein